VCQPSHLLTKRGFEVKIAICLYGLARGNKNTWASLCQYVIEPFQADLFIHTWLPEEDLKFHIPQKNTSNQQLEKFYRFFSSLSVLKSLSLSKQSLYEEIICDKFGEKIYFRNQCNMFDSINNCALQVLSCSLKYDYIIFCRADLLFKERLDIFDEKWDFYHGGIFNKVKNAYDFEDTFFIVKGAHLNIVPDIVKYHRSKHFILNAIGNPILHYVRQLGLSISSNRFSYNKSYSIVRNYDVAGYMKRLKAIILRYASKY
jgi:hypothetical protein